MLKVIAIINAVVMMFLNSNDTHILSYLDGLIAMLLLLVAFGGI